MEAKQVPTKQELIEASIYSLEKVADRLSDLADKIEHNSNGEIKPEGKRVTTSLSSLLAELPAMIDAQAKRIDGAIAKIGALLF